MAFEVIWTTLAEEDFQKVIGYLQTKWSEDIASAFVNKVQRRIERLSTFPFSGLGSKKDKSIRSIVLTKHNRLYYRIKNEKIEVLNIFDTRQNPEKNSYE